MNPWTGLGSRENDIKLWRPRLRLVKTFTSILYLQFIVQYNSRNKKEDMIHCLLFRPAFGLNFLNSELNNNKI